MRLVSPSITRHPWFPDLLSSLVPPPLVSLTGTLHTCFLSDNSHNVVNDFVKNRGGTKGLSPQMTVRGGGDSSDDTIADGPLMKDQDESSGLAIPCLLLP